MPKLPTLDCTGCTACANLCPTGAITMAEDAEGFLRPRVDSNRCVNCGKCEKTCPILKARSGENAVAFGVFAAKTTDGEAHRRSQSGGAFHAIAAEFLQSGGIVYGAALNETFETEHIRICTPEDLPRLQGVKYIQSRLGDSFSRVATDLNAGKPVLFSGTPCQVAGLTAFLTAKKVPTETLLTCDLVCYGVPSPGVFRQWVACLEKAKKSRLAAMVYRRTDGDWGKGKEYYRLENGTELKGEYFTKFYFNNLIIRPSCENCRFCNLNRPGDLTVGDFWGIEKALPDFCDDRGVSLVFCSTKKGREALDRAGARLILAESTAEIAAEAQPRLRGIPVKPSPHRAAFWEKLRSKGMAYIAIDEGFIPPSLSWRIRKKLEQLKKH